MNNISNDLPISIAVLEPLNFGGEQDVTKILQDVVRTVDERTEKDHLAAIKDVYAQLKETRSRLVKWSNGDPQYCSALNKSSFLDLTMIELFGLCDHIPIGPDGLVNDILFEAREPWFSFDDWNISTLQAALDLLIDARDGIQSELKNTVNN
mgnify:CR=1 FL=1